MIKNKNAKKGQSILEMVFAIGILLMVVSAILALTAAGIFGQKESESQIIANNLAREGIEVVRNIRDSNWLSGISWDTGLTNATKEQAIVSYDSPSLNFDYNNDNLYIVNGLYRHDGSGGALSGYRRHLTINSICRNTTCPGASCGEELIKLNCDDASEQKVGIKVRATVEWIQRNINRKVNIEDLIYDWK